MGNSKVRTIEQNKLRSEQTKVRWQNPEYRRMHTEAIKKSCNTPERKKVTSEASKKNWWKPEYRNRLIAFKTRHSPEERFWVKVTGQPDPDACWIWLGSLTSGGYGRFHKCRINGKSIVVRAHRFAYELMVDVIPEGLEPDHLCRNLRCVNPAHIELVTHAVNVQRGARWT